MYLSLLPENIRNLKTFDDFRGKRKGASGLNGLKIISASGSVNLMAFLISRY